MLNVFFIHSGITAITAYDIVRQKLSNNEDVVILTGRGQKWYFFAESLKVIDFDELMRGKGANLNLRNIHIRNILKQIRDWKLFIKNRNQAITECVSKGQNYIAYVPIFMDALICNTHCKGYYFLEEGQFAYLSKSYIKKITRRTSQAYFKTIFFPLFGQRYYPIDFQNDKFLGSVAITKEAFPWHQQEHIVSDVTTYINDVNYVVPLYDNIVVTGFLLEDITIIEQYFKILSAYIKKEQLGNVAVKLHPHVYLRYPQKAKAVEEMVKNVFKETGVTFLPKDYIVENNIFNRNTNIFSLIYVSSLSLYATMFGCGSFLVHEDKGFYKVERISTIQDYLYFSER